MIHKLFKKISDTTVLKYYVKSLPDGRVRIEHGQFLGKPIMQIVDSKLKKVEDDIERRIKDKLKSGYIEINYIDETRENLGMLLISLTTDHTGLYNNLLPMKAIPFEYGKVTYPRIGQRKYNGLRCVLRWEKYTTGSGLFKTEMEGAILRAKNGLKYILPHITNNLTKEYFFVDGMELIYDGELYIHGKALNYIKASCPVEMENGTITKSENSPGEVAFVMFDLSIPEVIQSDRLDILNTMYVSMFTKNLDLNAFRHTSSVFIHSDEQAENFRDRYIKMGYEGLILRDPDGEYQFGKRNSTMYKFKKPHETICTIVDIIEKSETSDRVNIVFVLRNDINDNLFECTPIGDNDVKREYLIHKDKYISKACKVKYYERSGVNKLPYHANVIEIL